MAAQQVSDIMTPDPVACPSNASVASAAVEMRDKDAGAILIEDQGDLCGIVTDRDIAVGVVAQGKDPGGTKVGELCHGEVATLEPDASVDDAVQLMRDKKIRRIPVVEDGQAVGIISIGDLAIERDANSALGEISAAAPNN